MLKMKSTTLLTAGSILGIVATGYLSVKCTDKYRYLKKRDEKLCKNKGYSTTAKQILKAYFPLFVVGGVTCYSVVKLNIVHKKENAELLASVVTINETVRQCKDTIPEDIWKRPVDKPKKASKEVPQVSYNGGDLLCYESFSGRYFYSTAEKVREAQAKLNRDYRVYGYIGLNDYYRYLEIDSTQLGQVMGWTTSESCSPPIINFTNTMYTYGDNPLLQIAIDEQCFPFAGYYEI